MISVGSWVSPMVGLLCRDPRRGWCLHTGVPCRLGEAGALDHTHKSGFCCIYALICSWAWLQPLSSNPWEHLGENPTVIQRVGDGWGTVRKAAGFSSTSNLQGEGRWEQISMARAEGSCLLTHWYIPPALPLLLSFLPGYKFLVFVGFFGGFFWCFFEGKQRALRGQREKWGVSEEREHSCEKCHSYLGNWKYFPSLPEWSFPDFNYFPIVSKKHTWPLTSFGPEEIRLSTF